MPCNTNVLIHERSALQGSYKHKTTNRKKKHQKTPPPPVTQLPNTNLLKTYVLHHITPGQLLGRQ